MGIELPPTPAPVAAYVPAVRTGNMVYTAGQLPMRNGSLKYSGVVGKAITLEQAVDAARISALNCLAAVKSVAGSLDEIEQIIKITGWVASADDFLDQAKVMNGASELIGEIFEAKGHHARAALGVNVLPLGSPVEIEMIVRLKE